MFLFKQHTLLRSETAVKLRSGVDLQLRRHRAKMKTLSGSIPMLYNSKC